VLTNDEDPGIIGGNYDYEVAREGNKLSRTEKTYGTVETWNSENQEWQSQTEEEKKETETAKQREQAKEQQTSIASINDKLDTIADKGRSTWFDKKLWDTLLTDVTDLKPKNSAYKDNDYRQDSQLSEEQIKALQGIDTTSLPRDMTIRQYTEYARDPLKAAQEFASRDKPEKLPGGLGEDGVQYQKNNTGTVFAYRADSEVPKIVTDKWEVDVQEYLKDKPQVNELFIGNGKSITTTPDPSGMRTYALVEKDNDDNIVSTREIKQDGTLFEQQSEAPTSVASR
jgi:multidrug efflux pump subunit AcrB